MTPFERWIANPSRENCETMCAEAGVRLAEILSDPVKCREASLCGTDFEELRRAADRKGGN